RQQCKYLRADVQDSAGVDLIAQLGARRRVPFCGEQEGGCITAPRQRHPSSHTHTTTDAHRDTHTHTHTETNTHTHTHRDKHTHTHRDKHTHTSHIIPDA